MNFVETRAYTRRRSCLHLWIFNVHVSTARYTLMTRLGRGFRPGLSGRPVRSGVLSPARYGALPESPGSHAADRSASERPYYVTETRGGGCRQADRPPENRADDLKRELAEIRRQLAEMRSESSAPGVSPGLSRVDRIGPDQTGTTPEQSVMDGSAATRPETTGRSGPARPTLKLGTYNGTTPERDRRPDPTSRRPPPAAGPTAPARSTDDQPKERTPIVCYGCGQPGHVVRECPSSTSRRRAKKAQFRWEDPIDTCIDVDFAVRTIAVC